ncbi:MAG TPA: ribosome-associated translation inhibitor RaiA [Polyangia bacterium]|nr:ribosome-associated translation inhibitor RaiA [Polyangia bacterium]
MQLSTTFRHMDASQAVREYSEEKLEKIRKYFHKEPIAAHAVFSVERGFNHVAEINITLPSGLLINAKETTEDMYSSIDLAVARIERQVRRWKDKIRDHKPHDMQISLRERVISAEAMEPTAGATPLSAQQAPAQESPVAAPFHVFKEETFTVRTMRVNDAVMQLNLLGSQFLVFSDVDSHGISVVYRRPDGNYGLIETGRAGNGA